MCELKAQKSTCCLTVVLLTAPSRAPVASPFQHPALDQFSEAHGSYSVAINASRNFQQFSQLSGTIINKLGNTHKLFFLKF